MSDGTEACVECGGGTMLDLSTIDSKTMKAGVDTDALIAEWMGWRGVEYAYHSVWDCGDGRFFLTGTFLGIDSGHPTWSPSTNLAHALEAMLEAREWTLFCDPGVNENEDTIGCEMSKDGKDYMHEGRCCLSETNGNKGEAMALAICRAIVAALKAVKLET